jgi:hypothetical protein
MLRCAISFLSLHLLPQYQEGVDLPRLCLNRFPHPEPPPHKKFFQQSEARAGYE